MWRDNPPVLPKECYFEVYAELLKAKQIPSSNISSQQTIKLRQPGVIPTSLPRPNPEPNTKADLLTHAPLRKTAVPTRVLCSCIFAY